MSRFSPIECDVSKVMVAFNAIDAPEFDGCPLLKRQGVYSNIEFSGLVDWLILTHGSKNWFKTCDPLPDIDPTMGGIVYLQKLCEWFQATFNDTCNIIPIEESVSGDEDSSYLGEVYSPISARTTPDSFEYVTDTELPNVAEYFNLSRYGPFKELYI